MPLLDKIFGKPDSILDLTDVPSISDARITALGSNSGGGSSLALRLPDTTNAGRLQSAVSERIFGSASVDDKTNPSVLNFDQEIKKDKDGNIEIDFTKFGGSKFKGTEEELTAIQGQALFDLIGASVFQQSSGSTLSLDSISGQRLVGTKPSEFAPANAATISPSTISNAQTSQRRSLTQPIAQTAAVAPTATPVGLDLDDIDNQFAALPQVTKIKLLESILRGE
jgi:hypothetical protein